MRRSSDPRRFLRLGILLFLAVFAGGCNTIGCLTLPGTEPVFRINVRLSKTTPAAEINGGDVLLVHVVPYGTGNAEVATVTARDWFYSDKAMSAFNWDRKKSLIGVVTVEGGEMKTVKEDGTPETRSRHTFKFSKKYAGVVVFANYTGKAPDTNGTGSTQTGPESDPTGTVITRDDLENAGCRETVWLEVDSVRRDDQ